MIKKERMMRLFTVILSLLVYSASAQVDLDYYLPEGYTYNPAIPTPASVLGYQVGEWHVSHDQVVMYMKALAAASDRVQLEEYGRSYEQRPLLLLTITAPENFSDLEQIKADRSNLRNAQAEISVEEMPIVMYMGHSVHGNEASGVNSSLLSAYHFAAANEIEEDLENIILLFDPAINPDGINRFASWVNSHKSYHMNGDPNNRELNEVWPRGRTNHYWFDLNRDWLPVQHPESIGRIAKIQEWKPNIVLDFHEMETHSTYFFQPGIPSRNHPLTPKKNLELTEKIATYHAKHLDVIGSLYFTKEKYDDFYYGKGSTYPDVQGAVGILFEQASSRGHLQETPMGTLTFPFTIRNQFTTALSSFEAARDMRVEMNQYMQDFYKEALAEADVDTNSAYIFGSKDDGAKVFHLADLILQHDIQLFSLEEDVTLNGVEFVAGRSFIVPMNQPQYRLIKGMFETRIEFEDSLFYDVSAWTLPMAFNLDYMGLNSKILNLAEVEEVRSLEKPKGELIGPEGSYSYAFEWNEYYAPKAAYKLMDKGYLVRVSHEPFQTESGQTFQRGSIVVVKGQSDDSDQEFYKNLEEIALSSGITVHALPSGYTSGINLGSPSIQVLEKPSVALLVEGGVNSNEAGEVWHLLDQRYEMAITLLAVDRFRNVDLEKYNVFIMPNGNYSGLGEGVADKLKSWVRSGGTVIARGGAMDWLAQNEIADFTFKTGSEPDTSTVQKSYANFPMERGSKVTGGAIFKVKLDITHPIGYGYSSPDLFTFRVGNQFLEPSDNPYANPMLYTEDPLASGYVYPFNLQQIEESGAIRVSELGRGKVIGYVDNPNFRAFWFGTNRLFINGIFFGPTITGVSVK